MSMKSWLLLLQNVLLYALLASVVIVVCFAVICLQGMLFLLVGFFFLSIEMSVLSNLAF